MHVIVFCIVCLICINVDSADDHHHRPIDFSRLDLIRYSSKEQLTNVKSVEKLLLMCGLNNEMPHEQPAEVLVNSGGLYIFQYPIQFAKYITFMHNFPIKSYLEIGCRWGGTFVFTVEYLSHFQTLAKAVAVDIIPSSIIAYKKHNPLVEFLQLDSQSDEFKQYMSTSDSNFDVIFIDGDHSYQGLRSDYELVKDQANILVFHDIYSNACFDVNRFWNEYFRTVAEDCDYYLFEFIDQYDEVTKRTGLTFLGIGVAIKVEYMNLLNVNGEFDSLIQQALHTSPRGALKKSINTVSSLENEVAILRKRIENLEEIVNSKLLNQ